MLPERYLNSRFSQYVYLGGYKMPDYAACMNKDCEKRKTCARYMMKFSNYQSVADFNDKNCDNNNDQNGCDGHIKCLLCDESIKLGEEFKFNPKLKKAFHTSCFDKKKSELKEIMVCK